jgi:hypothetical protein
MAEKEAACQECECAEACECRDCPCKWDKETAAIVAEFSFRELG